MLQGFNPLKDAGDAIDSTSGAPQQSPYEKQQADAREYLDAQQAEQDSKVPPITINLQPPLRPFNERNTGKADRTLEALAQSRSALTNTDVKRRVQRRGPRPD